jgi:hypothetical protein
LRDLARAEGEIENNLHGLLTQELMRFERKCPQAFSACDAGEGVLVSKIVQLFPQMQLSHSPLQQICCPIYRQQSELRQNIFLNSGFS